jgi:ribosomal protein L21E
MLLWFLVGAALKTNRMEVAHHAIDIAESYLSEDEWAEYYDGKNGRLIGRQARKYQTWTIASYLVTKEFMSHPGHLELLSFERE